MRVLLLAAGVGSRLAPLTTVIPKCLVPVNGHPLLSYWLSLLFEAGVKDILINTHHHHQQVENFIDSSPYKDSVSLSYERQLLGTAGTLNKHREFFNGEDVMLVHADNLSNFCLADFIQAFHARSKNCCMTMMSFTTDSPSSCGILELDKTGQISAFHEKKADPPGNLANGAVYIFEQEVLDYVAGLENAEADFSNDVIPHFIGRINTWHNSVYHRDIGTVESFLIGQHEFTPPSTLPTANGYWQNFWNADRQQQAIRFATLLAQSLRYSLISSGLEFDTFATPANPENSIGQLLLAKKYPTKITEADMDLLLIVINSDLSSQQIYREKGLSSIVLCSEDRPAAK